MKPGRGAAASFRAVLLLGVWNMYSNELEAAGNAVDAVGKALRGEEFDTEVFVEDGEAYAGTRELCAKIISVAQAAGELVSRVAALET
jgi:hypothetical protein